MSWAEHALDEGTSGDAEATSTDDELSPSNDLQVYLNKAGRYKLLTAAQEVELAKRIERGDKAAKERMINSNLRLVVWIAKRYQGRGLSLLDLIQEGNLGLMQAVERFDYRRDCRFSTFAIKWITGAVVAPFKNASPAPLAPGEYYEDRKAREREHLGTGRARVGFAGLWSAMIKPITHTRSSRPSFTQWPSGGWTRRRRKSWLLPTELPSSADGFRKFQERSRARVFHRQLACPESSTTGYFAFGGASTFL
jgi:hypothetical protein